MLSAETVIYVLLGGIVPTLLWLWFWRREDRLHPEPRRLILLAFVLYALYKNGISKIKIKQEKAITLARLNVRVNQLELAE